MTPLLARWACPALPAGLVLPGAPGTAAFLLRAGKHVARPVWPLPAVPLSRQPGIGGAAGQTGPVCWAPTELCPAGPPGRSSTGAPTGVQEGEAGRTRCCGTHPPFLTRREPRFPPRGPRWAGGQSGRGSGTWQQAGLPARQ